MRITSGAFKSRIIKAPGGIRPTLDNVRKAIFDILGGSVEGGKILDLFSGSGALGLEALSRGAGSCVFVDNSRSSVKAIKENLEALVFFFFFCPRHIIRSLPKNHCLCWPIVIH